MSKLVSTFIADVSRTAFLPCNQGKFKPEDIVAYINEELEQNAWADLVLQGEEFFLVTEMLNIKTNGHRNYPANIVPIPKRAYARAVREIKVVDASDVAAGNEPDKRNVPWITLEQAENFTNTGWDSVGLQDSNTSPYGCHFISDGIKFTGDFRDSDELLEIRYVVAPPTLESSADLHGDVGALDWTAATETVTLSVSAVGTDLDAYCADGTTKLFDIYRKSSGTILYANVPMTRTSLDFATTSLAAADLVQIATFQEGGFTGPLNSLTSGYTAEIAILPAGRQNHIPLSKSAINLLQSYVVQRLLAAQGDTEMMGVEMARTKESNKKLERIHDDRFRGEAKTIPMNNGLLNVIRSGSRSRTWR